jgi:hypothetical protein
VNIFPESYDTLTEAQKALALIASVMKANERLELFKLGDKPEMDRWFHASEQGKLGG